MKKLSMLATLVLILAAGVLPAVAITGGTLDGDAHPNVGAIVRDYGASNPPRYRVLCSGSLIAEPSATEPQVFLTAGHCTDYLQYQLDAGIIEAAYVSFDTNVYAASATLLPLAADGVVSHPDYYWGPISNPYDLGALILADPVSGIDPVTLAGEGFLDALNAGGELKHGKERATFTVVGYGATLDWPPREPGGIDGQRRYATSEFLNLRNAWLHMSQNQAPGRGDSGTCGGDSGGPTFWVTDQAEEILVAVTSWGDAPCAATGTAYRTDLASSLEFIDSLP